jgi:WhiB family redox-sensing transcriptional regulator
MSQPWRDRAACRGADPAIFFPRPGGPGARPAQAICARCPVTAQCLAHAVSIPEHHGVWGGLAERERYGMGPNEQPVNFRKAVA